MTITKVGQTTPIANGPVNCAVQGTPTSYVCRTFQGGFEEESSYLVQMEIRVCGTGCSDANHAWTIAVGPICGNKPGWIFPERQEPSSTTDNDRPTIQAWFTDTSSHACGPGAWEMKLDGAVVPATASQVGSSYVVSYTPPEGLAVGTHTVEAWVEEVCCNYWGEGQTDKGSTSWSFIVDFCGRSPLVLSSFTPTGLIGENRPLIQAVFTDNDHPCDLDQVVMILDANTVPVPVQPLWSRSGNTHYISYVPPVPLPPGPHSVSVSVVERGFLKNAGSGSWSFSVLGGTQGGNVLDYEDDVPGTIVSLVTPNPVGVERTCGPLGICVGPFAVPMPASVTIGATLSITHVDADANYEWKPYGPYHVDVPTPFGTLPFGVCELDNGQSPCVYPTPNADGTNISGNLLVTIDVNGERTEQNVPISLS